MTMTMTTMTIMTMTMTMGRSRGRGSSSSRSRSRSRSRNLPGAGKVKNYRLQQPYKISDNFYLLPSGSVGIEGKKEIDNCECTKHGNFCAILCSCTSLNMLNHFSTVEDQIGMISNKRVCVGGGGKGGINIQCKIDSDVSTAMLRSRHFFGRLQLQAKKAAPAPGKKGCSGSWF